MTCLIDMLHVGIKVGFGILNQVFLSIKIQHHTFSQDTFCKHFKNAKNFVYKCCICKRGRRAYIYSIWGVIDTDISLLKTIRTNLTVWQYSVTKCLSLSFIFKHDVLFVDYIECMGATKMLALMEQRRLLVMIKEKTTKTSR